MKKIVLLCAILFVSLTSKADQLAYITETQAKQATEFLKQQAEVILWCACCDNDTKQKVKITKVYYESVNYENFFTVKLEGITESGEKIAVELDLAYVHFKKKKKAYNVGKKLGFNCDPCTNPFNW